MATGEALSWEFEIINKATAPLKDIQKQLETIPKSAKEVEKHLALVQKASALKKLDATKDPLKAKEAALKIMQGELAKSAEQTKKLEAGFGKFASGAGVAAGVAVAAIASLGVGVGLLSKNLFELGLDAAAGKRAMMGALEVFEGKGTSNAFGVLQDMGIAAGISADQTVQSFQALRTAGFQAKEAQDIIAASFDVAAQMGGGEKGLAAAQKFQDLISKIGIMSKGGAKDLKAAVMGAGIPIEALQESVATRLKIPVSAAKAMLESGKVGEKTLQNSLLDVVQNKFDKGQGLGSKALDLAGSSPTAQLQSLKDAFGNLFEDVNIKPFAQAIKGIVDQLKGPGGDKLKEMAEQAFKLAGAFVGQFDIVGIFTKIVGWIGKGAELLGDFASSFSKSFDPSIVKDIFAVFQNGSLSFVDLKEIVGGIGTVFGVVANIILSVVRLLAKINAFTAPGIIAVFSILAEMVGVALDGIKGLAKGLSSLPGFIVDGFKGLGEGGGTEVGKSFGDSIAAGTTAALQIQSPSKVMQRLGAFTAEGFQVGLDSKEPSLSVGAPDVGGGAVGGSRSVTISIGDIHVAGGAEAVGEEIGSRVRVALLGVIEEMGLA